jgi:putative spermidine/putrescine transport system substrate-binding protein
MLQSKTILGLVVAFIIGVGAGAGVYSAILAPTSKTTTTTTTGPVPTLTIGTLAGPLLTTEQKVAQMFEQKYNNTIKVQVVAEGTTAVAALTALQSAKSAGSSAPWDIMYGPDVGMSAMISQGDFRQLDYTLIPNAVNVIPSASPLRPGYGPAAIITVPSMMVYNASALKSIGITTPLNSVTSLFDPRLQGKIAIQDQSSGWMTMLTFQQMGGCPLLDTSQTCALNLLTQKLLPNKPVFYSSAVQGETLMTTGQVWVELNSDGRVWDLVQKGFPVQAIIPQEGSWLTFTYVMGTYSSLPVWTERYIDFRLSPQAELLFAQAANLDPTITNLQLPAGTYVTPSSQLAALPAYPTLWFGNNSASLVTLWQKAIAGG